jgi:hypothetical protein
MSIQLAGPPKFYSTRNALAPDGARLSSAKLDDRKVGSAAALNAHGFESGDRRSLLLPNCLDTSRCCMRAVDVGSPRFRTTLALSQAEVNLILVDAAPHDLARHSSLPTPKVRTSWQRVLDQDPLGTRIDFPSEAGSCTGGSDGSEPEVRGNPGYDHHDLIDAASALDDLLFAESSHLHRRIPLISVRRSRKSHLSLVESLAATRKEKPSDWR